MIPSFLLSGSETSGEDQISFFCTIEGIEILRKTSPSGQLLPALLPVLPERHCSGLFGSFPNPPRLEIQLLSLLCKRMRTELASLCHWITEWRFSFFFNYFGENHLAWGHAGQPIPARPRQSPLVLLRCQTETQGTSVSSTGDQVMGWSCWKFKCGESCPGFWEKSHPGAQPLRQPADTALLLPRGNHRWTWG